MRINQENKSMDMETRDLNYILPAYVRSYLFYSKNEMPEKIVFPMFVSVSMLGENRQTISIPIEWVPPLDAIAAEIAEDGETVAEVTPEQEAVIDDKEEEIAALKAKMAELTEPEGGLTSEEQTYEAAKADQPTPTPEDLLRQQQESVQQIEDEAADQTLEVETEPSVSPAKAAFAQPPVPPVTPPPLERQPKQPPGGDIGPGSPPSDMHPRDSRDQVRTTRDLLEEPDITEAEEKPFEKEISRDESGKPVVEEKPSATD